MMTLRSLAGAVVGAVVMAGGWAAGQTDPAPAAGPAPKIVVETDRIDFGRMTDADQKVQPIVFRNEGDADLEILGLRGSCGCTVPSLEDLERKVFKPGESGTINVTFVATGKHGPQHTNVSITTNDPVTPVANVSVSAIVDPIVSVDPPSALFANLPKGREQIILLTVRGLKEGFAITEIVPNAGEHVSAKTLFEEDVEEDGVRFREITLEVIFDGKQKPGRIMGNITLKTNDERRPSVTVPVAGYVLGDVQPDVARWPIGNLLEPGTRITRDFRLTNRTGQPFRIVEVTDEFSNAEVPMQWEVVQAPDASPGVVVLRVTIQANERPGAMRGQLKIVTDVPDDPPIAIPYWGGVRPNNPPPAQTGGEGGK